MKELIKEEEVSYTKKSYKITCDICKKEIHNAREFCGEVTEEFDQDDNCSTTLCVEESHNDIDDFHFVNKSYHVCRNCFETVILPFMKEKTGIEPHIITEKDDDE